MKLEAHTISVLRLVLGSSRGLPQSGRQDKKHVQIAVLCLQEFLKDMCQQEKPRSGLKLVERVLNNAVTEDGLFAWYHHKIQVELAIPINTIATLTEEKWQKFY